MKQRFPLYPHVRNAYCSDINRQEHCQATGLSDTDEVFIVPGIISGEWSNNWVPEGEPQSKKKR